MSGEADFYKDGAWNFMCGLCGRKQKSTRAMFTWDGQYVCRHHKEVRNPQDFLRGVKDNQSVPWSRPILPAQDWRNPSIPVETTIVLLDTRGAPIWDANGYGALIYEAQSLPA